MINSLFSACDVFEWISLRYNYTPTKVQPFAGKASYSASVLSNQNNTYVWRPNKPTVDLGAPSASLSFPLFVGSLEIETGNTDPLSVSAANSYNVFTNFELRSIDPSVPFYNLQRGQFLRYGVGSFAGRAYPAAGVLSDFYRDQMFFCAPYLYIAEFTDATGSIYLDANFAFSGFMVDML